MSLSWKLNNPQKISLVQGTNWLTNRLISPQEKQWRIWVFQIFALPTGFFSPRKKPPIHCICRGFFDSRVLTLTVFPFICPFNLCFAALQETEIQDLQKMKRVCVDDKLPSGAELVWLPLTVACIHLPRSHRRRQFLPKRVGEWPVFEHQSSCSEEPVWQIWEGKW